MKNKLKVILVLVCVSVVWAMQDNTGNLSPEQQKAIEKEILKVQEEMKTAAENFKADELFKYVLDVNDVIIEDGVLQPSRREALNITRQGLQGIKELSYNYNHKNITVISPNTALWTGTGTTNVVLDDGRNFINDFAETIIFVLKNGQWKVLHAHRSAPNTN
jgi:hypothetical protein